MNNSMWIYICFLAIMPGILVAQRVSFPSDKFILFEHLTSFTHGKEVKGYSTIYPFQQISGFNRYEFHLDILDNNFQIIKESKFVISPLMEVKGTRFNGNAVCVSFDSGLGMMENHVYNLEGELTDGYKVVGKVIGPFSKVHPVPYRGFIRYVTATPEWYLEFRGNDGKILWNIYPQPPKLKVDKPGPKEELSFYALDSNYLILKSEADGIKASLITGNAKEHFRVYDSFTGEEICDLVQEDNGRMLVPSGVLMENDRFIVYGHFFEPDDSHAGYDGKKSLGFYLHTFDEKGNLLLENYHEWMGDVANFIQIKNEQADTSAWLHDLIRSASGNYFLMAELFHSKNAAVNDNVVFELDSLLDLKNVHRYSKTPNKISPKYQTYFTNDYSLGEELHEAKEFDYRYCTRSRDKATFSCVYANVENPHIGTKKIFVGAMAFNRDKELVHTGFKLDTNPESIRIIPAKAGYVAILEYYFDHYISRLSFYKLDM